MIRASGQDRAREAEACAALEAAWSKSGDQVRLVQTGYLDGFDFYVIKGGKTVGVGEIKSRNCELSRYPNMWLSAHKWLKLVTASQGLDVRGIFVANYTDCVAWIDVGDVDARQHTLTGRRDRPDAPNDTELIIEVPVESFSRVPKQVGVLS